MKVIFSPLGNGKPITRMVEGIECASIVQMNGKWWIYDATLSYMPEGKIVFRETTAPLNLDGAE